MAAMASHPIARHLVRAKDLADAQYGEPLTVADLERPGDDPRELEASRRALRLAYDEVADLNRQVAEESAEKWKLHELVGALQAQAGRPAQPTDRELLRLLSGAVKRRARALRARRVS